MSSELTSEERLYAEESDCAGVAKTTFPKIYDAAISAIKTIEREAYFSRHRELFAAADERLFQKLIDADVLLLSFAHSCLADIPTVIVDAYESIAESLFADGVELARDRLAPPNLALAVGAVKGAQTAMGYSGLAVA